ncbi:dihydrodipicolinate reductase [Ehrlichia chaffeensis str. Heartland]|uniref:4-hydroxy-tetrahydrodipicolinate reductase n=1 Tax=Ehrlichia chaffeensis (strain ATCC CRL-10679 / Arkansas) TaxID=205920 RepID=DAPB_EHRCR|nr:4-hydroxy-tetrahydrodipicolinate reductase [Ehrlichia chaffeensis]Q2GH22.1 RecName: Full=4-hydroxy-tetrahydrodipicolinate reductase; Short=HTPA reductase [Ehrlichia chaffeensis str. Arkansas]ABD45540.1 dihydrodipicolinate reductase [Ehrlichia chaffeensis str. Arkansas]AHX03542.1 dihydrodipicolinate reductase [Ehrlichia chaffeensis str. Heartland]AHX05737.1 dihydrodipicolinate reductase [Ehrlichia chaffeensis str. Jax]AHX06729.1 dihydrodipicolinate reductase [Ehrlichia chaffeensis str. Liber
MTRVNIGIVGCLGKQGRRLVSEISASPYAQVSGGLVRSGNPHVGQILGEVVGCDCSVKITDSLEHLFETSDIVIEFTNPDMLLECIKMAEQKKKPLLSGTTGPAATEMVFEDYIKSIPFLWTTNVSFGVNILAKLVQEAAKKLFDYDIEIWEMHHRYKKDSPSGTSLILGKAAAKGRNVPFQMAQYVRGTPQEARKDVNTIGYSVSRGGADLSDHRVMFVSDEEMIDFNHRTLNKNLYAKGALKAALWLVKQPPGVYTMSDMMAAVE